MNKKLKALEEKYPFLPLLNGVYVGDRDISKKIYRKNHKIFLPVNRDMYEEIEEAIPTEKLFSDADLMEQGIDNIIWSFI